MSQLRVSSVTDLSGAGPFYSPGHVVQVVSIAKTDVFSTSVAAGAFGDITGLSVTITPRFSTSKILLMAQVSGAVAQLAAGPGPRYRFMRNATPVGLGDVAGSRTPGSFGGLGSVAADEIESMISYSGTFLDSPATTSPVTYSIQVGHRSAGAATVLVNRSRADVDNVRTDRNISTITLMEIAQ
jgi:hypothetical protein